MSLNLYLDDCSNSELLADLLRQAGHRVVRPAEANGGLDGEDDDVDFAFAAANDLTIITKNPSDFQHLHDLDPHHFGILAVYQDNDAANDATEKKIDSCVQPILFSRMDTQEPHHDRAAAHVTLSFCWRGAVMPEWNPKANEIFLDALEIAAAAERRAYLDAACANDGALRQAVDNLLQAHDDAGSLLERPALAGDLTMDQVEPPIANRETPN